jgi:pepF/M3 family oligoendopeptidase
MGAGGDMTAPKWDLEIIYPGGPAADSFLATLDALEASAAEMITRTDSLPELREDTPLWAATIVSMNRLQEDSRVAGVFAGCHSSADAQSLDAVHAVSRTSALSSAVQRAWVPVLGTIATCGQDAFDALVAEPALADFLPRLHWVRKNRHTLLPPAEAGLAVELAKDGIHAWNRLYNRLSGTLMVTLPDGRQLSMSQAQNLTSSGDPEQRGVAFAARLSGWTTVADTCATALSHIVGTRLTLNRRRGVSILSDTLARSRMSEATLEAMLEASRRAAPTLKRYLKAKAQLLGRDQLRWEDQGAPVGEIGSTDWDSATAFIEEHFRSWSPELGDYAARAIRDRWIEAEDRPHKRPGGWCASVPTPPGASRIFMTFGETFRSTVTLAHELGHGYHNHVLRTVPPSRRHVPSTLAETASVFAENIVRDAALAAAQSDSARLAMLDARLSSGVSMLMNIPFRYQLERKLYGLREKGELRVEDLNALTVETQREAYVDSLESWHPLFWAEKLHFYISSFAFYNYPYTYGYLFSTLVYQHARQQGPDFIERYDDLLRRTAWEDAEPLAQQFLGIDLTDPDAWYAGAAPLEADLDAFLTLVQ